MAYMKIIRSKDNSTYKLAVKLLKRKFRDDTGMYLLEGVKPVLDAIDNGQRIEYIFIEDSDSDRGIPGFPESMVIGLDKKLFAEISDTNTSQGMIAMVQQQPSGDEQLDKLLEGEGKLMVLDRIQDPGNMGTIIRTAEAAGYGGVLLMKGCVDPYSPKVVRAAAGSLFRIPVVQKVSEEKLFAGAKASGRTMFVTALEDAIDYSEGQYDNKSIIVIGNEGQGVSENFKNAADFKIKIPMAGAIESLNAAVAAGILMYQSQKSN
ncbi:MAG: RNA methyltransferase [Eubacterium sp.]|nr:RNA methyltransferase [Candidatus Colimonas fimequi]